MFEHESLKAERTLCLQETFWSTMQKTPPWKYLSQAAACDGNYYQIPQEYVESNPPPGVLPI